MTVGERLKEMRARLGWSQDELGSRVSRTGATISRYESGSLQIAADELPRFAEALGVSAWDFYEGAPVVHTTLPGDDLAEEFKAFIGQKANRLPPHEQRAVYLAAGIVDTLLAHAG